MSPLPPMLGSCSLEEYREITEEDFIEISSWLSMRSWPMPNASKCLPKTGYVYLEDGKRMAAAYVYMTNSNVVIVSWVCTPPDSGTKGLEGIKKLAAHIQSVVSEDSVIMYIVSSEKLAKYLNRSAGSTKPKTTYNTYFTRR